MKEEKALQALPVVRLANHHRPNPLVTGHMHSVALVGKGCH